MKVNQHNSFKIIWNSIVFLSVGFLAIHLPLQISGIEFPFSSEGLYYFSTLIMLLDFIYRLNNHFKSEDKKGSKHDLPFLLVDGVAAIPFLMLTSIPLLQLLQLLKLIRVELLLERSMEEVVKWKRIVTISFFLFWLILVVHWLSCGWLSIIGIDTSIDAYTNYVKSLYWSITTLTTVGYGDITPSTTAQMWYAMFVQLIGIGGFGYLLAHVVSIVSKKDPVETQYAENVELLSTTMKHRDLPVELQSRILDYYRYMKKEKIGYDESAFLSSLPNMLQTEVAINLRKEFIQEIPLFNDAGDVFLSQIAMKLELMIATPGDYFFKMGEKGNEMFLIISGEVEVIGKQEDSVMATLTGGDYFGEIAMFDSTVRNASVRASKFCNLYKLKKGTFDEVVAKHPKIAEEIELKAKDRGKK